MATTDKLPQAVAAFLDLTDKIGRRETDDLEKTFADWSKFWARPDFATTLHAVIATSRLSAHAALPPIQIADPDTQLPASLPRASRRDVVRLPKLGKWQKSAELDARNRVFRTTADYFGMRLEVIKIRTDTNAIAATVGYIDGQEYFRAEGTDWANAKMTIERKARDLAKIKERAGTLDWSLAPGAVHKPASTTRTRKPARKRTIKR